MFILNSQLDPVGIVANLAFSLSGADIPLKAEIKVVCVFQSASDMRTFQYQTFPPGHGLVFVGISEEYRRLLKKFCEQGETKIFTMPTLIANPPAIQGQ